MPIKRHRPPVRFQSRWKSRETRIRLTRPVRARAEGDAEHHEDRSGGLDAHHGDAECPHELEAPRVRDLGRVLQRGEERGGDPEEGRPEL